MDVLIHACTCSMMLNYLIAKVSINFMFFDKEVVYIRTLKHTRTKISVHNVHAYTINTEFFLLE